MSHSNESSLTTSTLVEVICETSKIWPEESKFVVELKHYREGRLTAVETNHNFGTGRCFRHPCIELKKTFFSNVKCDADHLTTTVDGKKLTPMVVNRTTVETMLCPAKWELLLFYLNNCLFLLLIYLKMNSSQIGDARQLGKRNAGRRDKRHNSSGTCPAFPLRIWRTSATRSLRSSATSFMPSSLELGAWWKWFCSPVFGMKGWLAGMPMLDSIAAIRECSDQLENSSIPTKKKKRKNPQ
jgi:hypothetical protein